jgi:DnaJ-class molecular chaperone
MNQHEGHKITMRHSSWFCDTCQEAFKYAPDHCLDCNGRGWNRRMTSMYRGNVGKPYKCGKCKGSGKIAPKSCNFCFNQANYFTAQFNRSAFGEEQGPIRHFCESCYSMFKNNNNNNNKKEN